jgi:hypothetical protein
MEIENERTIDSAETKWLLLEPIFNRIIKMCRGLGSYFKYTVYIKLGSMSLTFCFYKTISIHFLMVAFSVTIKTMKVNMYHQVRRQRS